MVQCKCNLSSCCTILFAWFVARGKTVLLLALHCFFNLRMKNNTLHRWKEIHSSLTSFKLIFHFYNSWKRQKKQKFSDVFRGYRNGVLALNWLICVIQTIKYSPGKVKKDKLSLDVAKVYKWWLYPNYKLYNYLCFNFNLQKVIQSPDLIINKFIIPSWISQAS